MDHFGVDPIGIGRALLRNFEAGSVVEGGSTITQQLIKLQYLDSDRTIKRKIQEVVIAVWLEWKLGKQEILTRYLNSVYLGAGATGMPAAALIYFNKDIEALNLPESAMLAGLLRAPSQWNPIDNFEGARQRTAVVLNAMVANGKITAAEAEKPRRASPSCIQRRRHRAPEAGLPTGFRRRRAKLPAPRRVQPQCARRWHRSFNRLPKGS